ncbi:hyoscyamine 6-dioxygenase [Prunus yedoensis var. nudiflora]|uniref:Hyoscyamine 6-dioxygenase n=1 Tax=Prunus yedoensis var. nudiflora TaxID=2094558 RepID=A0A314ZKW4_PRUYE|nr:hyoscyamine 6-dioxygenase [Prunus yedoensis var. nudiflora]
MFFRERVGACSTQVREVALNILQLISEGLGLEPGYFRDELSQVSLLSVNNYPPCPDPSLTLGLPKHCDPNIITILLQGNVNGLQVFKDGEWIGVEPLPNALVVNIGYQLQIISNGKLKCDEHWAVTNSRNARTSAAFSLRLPLIAS